MNTNILASPAPAASEQRACLQKLSLGRGVLAVAWAAVFAGSHDTFDAFAIALLVVYPLIDAASSLIDTRSLASGPERRVTAFNATLSALAAVALGIAGSAGIAAALAVFGAWAVVSGLAQLVVGLRRRGTELGKQWPMLVAGGLSMLAGASYCIQAAGDAPSLGKLPIYATGGGVFFITQAGLLAWRSRQARVQVA